MIKEDVWDVWVGLQILTKLRLEVCRKRSLFEDLDAGGGFKSEINIKKILKRALEWIIFAQERHPWWKFVNMATIYRISQNTGEFLEHLSLY